MVHPDLSKRYTALQSYNKYMELMKLHMGKKIGSSKKHQRKQTPRRQTLVDRHLVDRHS